MLDEGAGADPDIVVDDDVDADLGVIGDSHVLTDEQVVGEVRWIQGATMPTSSHRDGTRPGLGVASVCLLLHNLIAGGSARQWVHLLGRHVEAGGRATIVAPTGPLAATAGRAGIETVDVDWGEVDLDDPGGPLRALDASDVAIVHWDYGVMDALDRARRACGRVALAVHQTPDGMARWWGPEIVPRSRLPLERAAADPHAVILVRGEWHRERFVSAFGLPPDRLHVLPASIPLPAQPPQPASAAPEGVLALTRLSEEKAPIVELAAEMTLARLEDGPCALALAGDGAWREEAVSFCERRLPPSAWRLEPPPADPIARLAAADLVVAQGLTTLEAAALERRVVVARPDPDGGAAGIVLTPGNYDAAARDPFGRPPVDADADRLWREAVALGRDELGALRAMVERHNSLEATERALAEALAATA